MITIRSVSDFNDTSKTESSKIDKACVIACESQSNSVVLLKATFLEEESLYELV